MPQQSNHHDFGHVPYPEGDLWDNLGAHVRHRRHAQRRRRQATYSLLALVAFAGILAALSWPSGKPPPNLVVSSPAEWPDRAISQPAESMGKHDAAPAIANQAECHLARIKVLTLQIEIDSLAVAFKRSELADSGLNDLEIWQACDIEPERVLGQYMELL